MFDWEQFLELLPLWLPEFVVACVAIALFLLKGGLSHSGWPWIVFPILFIASAATLQFAPIYFKPLEDLFIGNPFLYWVGNAVIRLAGWGSLFYGLFWKRPAQSHIERPVSPSASDAAVLASLLAVLLIEARERGERRELQSF